MAWRPAKCLVILRDEISAAYPNRVKAQDGIIGNAEHQARKSDHNPDSHGVVHAIDVDARGIPVDSIVNHIHGLALAGDQRLAGGYLIWNRHIASAAHGWVWRGYDGADPHNLHFHMSCTYDPACDWTAPWGITTTDQGEPDMAFEQSDKEKLNQIFEWAKANQLLNEKQYLEQILQEVKDDPNTGAGAGDLAPADVVRAFRDALSKGVA